MYDLNSTSAGPPAEMMREGQEDEEKELHQQPLEQSQQPLTQTQPLPQSGQLQPDVESFEYFQDNADRKDVISLVDDPDIVNTDDGAAPATAAVNHDNINNNQSMTSSDPNIIHPKQYHIDMSLLSSNHLSSTSSISERMSLSKLCTKSGTACSLIFLLILATGLLLKFYDYPCHYDDNTYDYYYDLLSNNGTGMVMDGGVVSSGGSDGNYFFTNSTHRYCFKGQ